MVERCEQAQFLHLRVPDAHLLRRPISISSIDKANKQCHLIYRIEGLGPLFSTLSREKLLVWWGLREMVLTCLIWTTRTSSPRWWGLVFRPCSVARIACAWGESINSPRFANKDAVILEKELAQYGQVFVTTDDMVRMVLGKCALSSMVKISLMLFTHVGLQEWWSTSIKRFYDHPRAIYL